MGKEENSNCSDPKTLITNSMPTANELKIDWIKIKTFEGEIMLNSTSAMELLQWDLVNLEMESLSCFELTIPKEVFFYIHIIVQAPFDSVCMLTCLEMNKATITLQCS